MAASLSLISGRVTRACAEAARPRTMRRPSIVILDDIFFSFAFVSRLSESLLPRRRAPFECRRRCTNTGRARSWRALGEVRRAAVLPVVPAVFPASKNADFESLMELRTPYRTEDS